MSDNDQVIKRIAKRLEIRLDVTAYYLTLEQARRVAMTWISEHEQNEDVYAWEYSTTFQSGRIGESWVIVYTQ